MSITVNDGGTLKPVKEVWVQDALGWRPADAVWVNDKGTWKRAFLRGTEYDLYATFSNESGEDRYGYSVYYWPYLGSLTPSPMYNGIPVAEVGFWPGRGNMMQLIFRGQLASDSGWSTLVMNGIVYTKATATRVVLMNGQTGEVYGIAWQWPNKKNPFVPGNTYKARIY